MRFENNDFFKMCWNIFQQTYFVPFFSFLKLVIPPFSLLMPNQNFAWHFNLETSGICESRRKKLIWFQIIRRS